MLRILKFCVRMIVIYVLIATSIIYIASDDLSVFKCLDKAISFTYNEFNKSLDDETKQKLKNGTINVYNKVKNTEIGSSDDLTESKEIINEFKENADK